jgi:phenylalanyl-tRNA synthetase beta chain
VTRDIALLVNANVAVQALLDAIADEKPAIVLEVRLFDVYQGPNLPPGRKSLAFRVVMQDTERTLTDAEADSARQALVELWGRRFAATPRV